MITDKTNDSLLAKRNLGIVYNTLEMTGSDQNLFPLVKIAKVDMDESPFYDILVNEDYVSKNTISTPNAFMKSMRAFFDNLNRKDNLLKEIDTIRELFLDIEDAEKCFVLAERVRMILQEINALGFDGLQIDDFFMWLCDAFPQGFFIENVEDLENIAEEEKSILDKSNQALYNLVQYGFLKILDKEENILKTTHMLFDMLMRVSDNKMKSEVLVGLLNNKDFPTVIKLIAAMWSDFLFVWGNSKILDKEESSWVIKIIRCKSIDWDSTICGLQHIIVTCPQFKKDFLKVLPVFLDYLNEEILNDIEKNTFDNNVLLNLLNFFNIIQEKFSLSKQIISELVEKKEWARNNIDFNAYAKELMKDREVLVDVCFLKKYFYDISDHNTRRSLILFILENESIMHYDKLFFLKEILCDELKKKEPCLNKYYYDKFLELYDGIVEDTEKNKSVDEPEDCVLASMDDMCFEDIALIFTFYEQYDSLYNYLDLIEGLQEVRFIFLLPKILESCIDFVKKKNSSNTPCPVLQKMNGKKLRYLPLLERIISGV